MKSADNLFDKHRDGEVKELVTTPGHHFLDRFANFPTIDEMLENGRATVVRSSGALIGGNSRNLWSAAA